MGFIRNNKNETSPPSPLSARRGGIKGLVNFLSLLARLVRRYSSSPLLWRGVGGEVKKYSIPVVLFLVILTFTLSPVIAQEPTLPAPTLVPPTLVPGGTSETAERVDYSGIATIKNEGVLRVGARYNMYPFSYLNEKGELAGYEVDVLTAIGVELGVLIEWMQVTGENEIQELWAGRVDVLIGEQVHTRDREQFLDFSHPYYLNKQYMVVTEAASYQSFEDMRGQPIAVVEGSFGEIAAQDYPQYGWDIRPYFTEKDALDALADGEVQGMVGEFDDLQRAGRQQMRLIEQPVRLDLYAVAMRRYDVNMRNALDRAIQRLLASGRLDEIYSAWFSESLDFEVLVPAYENLFEDARTINDFNIDMPIPPTSLVEKIRSGQPLNVAGLSLNPEAPTHERYLDSFNKSLMDELARRWGATVNYIPNTALNAVDFLVNGGADIAIGVTPRWDGADRFDYSRPYALHGDRVMVLEGSRYQSFSNFRGGSYMGFWYEDTEDRARIEQVAEALRVNTTVYEFRSTQEIIDQFNARNVDGVFGDILRLQSIISLTSNSGLPWKILDEEYSKVPWTIAMPRNDADMRSLVDWTLQDMFLDGSYQRIYRETYGEGEPITMLTWAGNGDWLVRKYGGN
jgi:polar amino acid transport system substrate-binding protein